MAATQPNSIPPAAIFAPDVYAQQVNLSRQQKMAEMLQQQGMEAPQGQMISGHYVAPAATQHLARLASMLGGTYMMKNADEKQVDVARQYGQAMSGQVDNMLGGSQPSTVENSGQQAPQEAPQVSKLRNAARSAMLMGNTDLANKLIGNMLELTNNQKDMAAMGQDPREMGRFGMAVARKKGIMEMQPGARAVDLSTGVSAFNPKVSEGITLDNNGVASQVPGYAQASSGLAGANAGAVESAKAPYKMITVNIGGTPVTMTEAQAQQLSGQTQPQNNVKFDNPNGASLNFQGMNSQQVFDMVQKMKDPAAKQEAMQALGQMSKQSQPVGIRGQGTADTTFEQGQGKYFSDSYGKLQDSAQSANTKIASLDRMSQLLDGVSTGKLTPTTTQISAVADSLGLKIDPKLGAKQAVEALSNEVALQLRNPSGGAGMPGALSNSDRDYLKSMVPGLGKTTEGNKLMIEAARKLATREQDVAKLAREYVSQNGRLDNGFFEKLQQYSDTNPLFKAKQSPVDIRSQADAILKGQ